MSENIADAILMKRISFWHDAFIEIYKEAVKTGLYNPVLHSADYADMALRRLDKQFFQPKPIGEKKD